MRNNTDGAGSPVQSVDRAVSVLEILARCGEAGVTELAAQLDVHKSTAFRLVSALEARGLVEQNSERGKYRLGHGIIRLAGATAARMDLVRDGHPIAEALARETNETVNITILSGGEALYIDQVAGSAALRTHNWLGQRIPLHCTSNGKVLLAFAPRELREEVLAQPLVRFTDRTMCDPDDVRADLDRVVLTGWARAIGELEPGLAAVAAPVRGIEGTVIASLSVSGSTYRIDASRLEELGTQVCRAADAMSARMGWFGTGFAGARGIA